MTQQEVEAFLRPARVGTLSTLDGDGWPHPTAMWFVHSGASLLLWSYAKSQKVVNVRRDSRAAFLVETGESYGELQGVMVRGRVGVTDRFEDVAQVGRLLFARYVEPGAGDSLGEVAAAEVERQARKRVALELPLERVSSWDFRKL